MENNRIRVIVLAVCAFSVRAMAQERSQQGEAAPHVSAWQSGFEEAFAAAQAAEAAQRWEEGVRLYERVQEFIPGEPTTLVSQARCLIHLGRGEAALLCLGRAVEGGWTLEDQLRSDAAFVPLHGSDDFERLFVRMAEIRAEPIVVYVPAALDRTRPAPLIVAFHGRAENPHLFMPSWKQAADTLGAVVVAPRGVRTVGDGLPNVWEKEGATSSREIDVDACRVLLESCLQRARAAAKVDERRMVLAGYSQGGAVALALLCRNPDRFVGAFAQATVYMDGDADLWRAARGRVRDGDGRVVLISGELDRLRPHAELARDHLTGAGWDVRFEVVPGVGHEPPGDNTRRQIEAVRYLLAGERESATQGARE